MTCREAAEKVMERLKSSAGDGRWNDHLSLATWEWPQGVAMFAMAQELEATGDEKLRDEMVAWYDGHIERGLPARKWARLSSNGSSMKISARILLLLSPSTT